MPLSTTALVISSTLAISAKLYHKKKTHNMMQKIHTKLSVLRKNFVSSMKARNHQIGGIVSNEVKESEKKLNLAFNLASVNLGVVAISIFYSPLLWLVILLNIFSNTPIYRIAYKKTISERKISSYMLDSILTTSLLLGGYYYTAVIGSWVALLGRKLLLHSEHNAKKELFGLFDTQPRFVWTLTDDNTEIEVPLEQLQQGDIVMTRAGQMIAVDGIIVSGYAAVDQHKLTGESQPVEKGVGDKVLAATVVLAGQIGIQTEQTGQETVAMQIGQILAQTTDFRNALQTRGELIADKMTLPTLGLSAVCLPVLGYSAAITVLTNTFGYKMRLFGPASMLSFLHLASQAGILIKDGCSLELLNQIDTVVFDKTGTLTLEQPTVGRVHTYQGYHPDDVLIYAAAAEDGQSHPVAKAILVAAHEQSLEWPDMLDTKYTVGYGIQIDLPDRVVRVGSQKFMAMENIDMPTAAHEAQRACHQSGNSLVFVACGTKVVGAIELQATIRSEAKTIINGLRQRGISVHIISGDHEAPTKALANTLGIEHYSANTLPENKADLISALQKQGKSVCFVGDGINDAIALKQADVSVSLQGATTIATDTAQVILMNGDLEGLVALFEIAEKFENNMKNNLLISTVPATMCIGGIIFLHWGVVAGMVITLSTLFIGIINSIWPLLNQPYTVSRKSLVCSD